MDNEFNIFPVEECRKLIARITDEDNSDPNQCIGEIEKINKLFREALNRKCSFDDLAISLKDDVSQLLKFCVPRINYEIKAGCKAKKCKDRINGVIGVFVVPNYQLNINTTAEEIAAQVDEVYALAVNTFTIPILRKGVTPKAVLQLLWDKYTLEEGVDGSDDIHRIVSRIVNRLFSDSAEGYTERSENACVTAADGANATPDARPESIVVMAEYIATLQTQFSQYVSEACKSSYTINSDAASELAKWIQIPNMTIEMKEQTPYEDAQLKGFVVPYPLLQKTVNKENVIARMKAFVGILKNSSHNYILKAPVEQLKKDIEDIDNQPAQNIDVSLKQVIENNFNVRFIEINTEDSRYANPEYFEVSRSNVDKVVTTRPAVIDCFGKVIFKGRYLVPQSDKDKLNNQHH